MSGKDKTLTQEAEHVLLQRRGQAGVEQEAVSVGAGLVAAVGRDDEEGQRAVLQLVAHLRDGLAVASAAVVHALTCTTGRG